jgi:hypothetical protein
MTPEKRCIVFEEIDSEEGGRISSIQPTIKCTHFRQTLPTTPSQWRNRHTSEQTST